MMASGISNATDITDIGSGEWSTGLYLAMSDSVGAGRLTPGPAADAGASGIIRAWQS